MQISLLNAEHNSQLMLLGARNLTLLADVLPTICSSIVRHGAVPALCARLMTIEYIDLAEQSLQVSRSTAAWLVQHFVHQSLSRKVDSLCKLLKAYGETPLAALST